MRRLLPFLLLLAACGKSVGTEPARTVCTFKFSETPRCAHSANARSIGVVLKTQKLAEDEIGLLEARVSVDGKSHVLKLSPDASMIEGDIGSIILEDVSFDGVPDLAVATSFGTANQYLDYWIYDPTNKSYLSSGNLPRLTPVLKDKSLRAAVKVNAAKLEEQIYAVVGNKIERRK